MAGPEGGSFDNLAEIVDRAGPTSGLLDSQHVFLAVVPTLGVTWLGLHVADLLAGQAPPPKKDQTLASEEPLGEPPLLSG